VTSSTLACLIPSSNALNASSTPLELGAAGVVFFGAAGAVVFFGAVGFVGVEEFVF
jgi:hypothetical protein